MAANTGASSENILFALCVYATRKCYAFERANPLIETDDSPSPTVVMNKSTVRILDIFSCFGRSLMSGLRVTELSNKLGMTKQSTVRALKTLCSQGYLVKDWSGRRYELGYRLLELSTFDPAEPDLRQICAPYMQQLHALTQASVLLVVPVGYHAVIIDGIDGVDEQAFQLRRYRRGFPIPLNVGPAARVILAYLPDEEIQRFIEQGSPFSDPTARYVVNPNADALWTHIRQIRQRGYDIAGGELLPNSSGLAFPIFDAMGYPLGSIGLSSTEARMPNARFIALAPALKQVMDELNKQTRMRHAT